MVMQLFKELLMEIGKAEPKLKAMEVSLDLPRHPLA